MKHYAGIDLSMETSHVCIVDAEGQGRSAMRDSTPEAIAALLERHGPMERVVIETGRMTPWVARGLHELGVAIVCIDARQAHQSLKAMKANKTDPHDAAGLAQLARTGFYKEVHVKSPTSHGVRSVITARAHLVEARVRLDNTIRGLCATFGIRPGAGQGERFLARCRPPSLSRGSARQWLRCFGREPGWSTRSVGWIASSRRSASPLQPVRR
jgi:transposase